MKFLFYEISIMIVDFSFLKVLFVLSFCEGKIKGKFYLNISID